MAINTGTEWDIGCFGKLWHSKPLVFPKSRIFGNSLMHIWSYLEYLEIPGFIFGYVQSRSRSMFGYTESLKLPNYTYLVTSEDLAALLGCPSFFPLDLMGCTSKQPRGRSIIWGIGSSPSTTQPFSIKTWNFRECQPWIQKKVADQFGAKLQKVIVMDSKSQVVWFQIPSQIPAGETEPLCPGNLMDLDGVMWWMWWFQVRYRNSFSGQIFYCRICKLVLGGVMTPPTLSTSEAFPFGKNSVLWLVPDAWSTFIADQICHPFSNHHVTRLALLWHSSNAFRSFWKNRSRPGAIFSGFSWSGGRKLAALNFIRGTSKVLRGKASLEIVNKHFQSHKGDFLTPKFGGSFWEIGPGLGPLGAAFKLIPDVCTKPKLQTWAANVGKGSAVAEMGSGGEVSWGLIRWKAYYHFVTICDLWLPWYVYFKMSRRRVGTLWTNALDMSLETLPSNLHVVKITFDKHHNSTIRWWNLHFDRKHSTDLTLQRFAQHGAVLQSARAGAGLQALAAVEWSWMIHILPNLLQQFHGKSDIRVCIYIHIYIHTLYILVHMIYKVTGWFGALGRVADSILMILFWWIENVVFVTSR